MDTDRGTIQVEIADPLLALAEKLQEAHAEEEAILALHKADTELERLEAQRRVGAGGRESIGPVGLEFRLPDAFGRP